MCVCVQGFIIYFVEHKWRNKTREAWRVEKEIPSESSDDNYSGSDDECLLEKQSSTKTLQQAEERAEDPEGNEHVL